MKDFAEHLSESLALVRNEIAHVQEEIIDSVDTRIDEISAPVFEKILDRLLFLESEKNRIEREFEKNALKIFEEHVHQTILQEFNVTLPEDVVRQAAINKLDEDMKILTDSLQEQINAVRSYEHPDLARADHRHDGVYAPLDHTHLDLWADLTKARQQMDSDQQAALERHYTLQTHFETLQGDIHGRLAKLFSSLEDEKTNNINRLATYRTEIAEKVRQIVESVIERFDRTDEQIGKKLAHLQQEITEVGQDFHLAIDAVNNRIARDLEGKSHKDHTHDEFRNLAEKIHTHKEIGQLDNKITKLDSDTLKKEDVEQIIKQVIAKIHIPRDGKDALNWQFRFDVNRRGLLLYKREDETEWRQEFILGPKGDPGPAGDGSGSGWTDTSAGGGGSAGATFDAYVNGELLSRGIYEVDFIGPNVQVTNPFTGRIEVTYQPTENGSALLFIQPTQPVVPAGTKYQWIQTDPSNGSVITVWVDDGVH